MMLLVNGATRTLRALRAAGRGNVGQLLSPKASNRIIPGMHWAVDNGSYSGFDAVQFAKLLSRREGQPRCLWVAAPDRPCDARRTLQLYRIWREYLNSRLWPIALVLQNGQESLELPWNELSAVFIGGNTAWKLSRAAADLASEAKGRGLSVHMGRVNSLRRLRAAANMGCDSVDGGCMSMFPDRWIALYSRYCYYIDSQPMMF
jgi:hypothetical protein